MKKLPLNLIYLKYFCDAVKHGSISASAKSNYVSQSAISQAISKLEEGMGHKLIAHQPNRFQITEEGEKLFEVSQTIFQTIRSAEEYLGNEESGSIECACSHSFALSILTYHLKEAKQMFPDVKINFRLGHTDSIREWLKKGLIDFGIVLDNEDLSSYDCEEIYQGQYQLYVAKDCTDISNLRFLISEERIETNLLKKGYKKHFTKDLPVLMEISSWEVIARLTEEGLGIGFFPDYVAKSKSAWLQPCLQELEPIPYKIFAIFPKNMPKSIRAFNFLNLLQAKTNANPHTKPE